MQVKEKHIKKSKRVNITKGRIVVIPKGESWIHSRIGTWLMEYQ